MIDTMRADKDIIAKMPAKIVRNNELANPKTFRKVFIAFDVSIRI